MNQEEYPIKEIDSAVELSDIIEDLVSKSPRDKRKVEYKQFVLEYKRLTKMYNKMVNFKCYKEKI